MIEAAILYWPPFAKEVRDAGPFVVRLRDVDTVAQAHGWFADFLLCEGRKGEIHGVFELVRACAYCGSYAVKLDEDKPLCARCAWERWAARMTHPRVVQYDSSGAIMLMAGKPMASIEGAKYWAKDHSGWVVEIHCARHGWQGIFGDSNRCMACEIQEMVEDSIKSELTALEHVQAQESELVGEGCYA